MMWRRSGCRRVALALALLLGVILLGFAGYVFYRYTGPVPISQTEPTTDNDALRQRIFDAKEVMFVGAHPDDIEFYCGGLVHLLRKAGAQVTFVLATRGGKGRVGGAKKRIEGLRTRHQHDAARILGGVNVIFYDYPDKELPDYVQPLADDLRRLIHREKPDIVFSWDPDYIYNPHPDHQAAARAVEMGAAGSTMCFYGTREPNLWIGYGEDVFRLKLRSLRAHRTETPWYFWPLARRFLTRKSIGEGAKIDARYAEVYRFEDW